MPSLRDLIVVHGTGDRCTLTVLGSAVALAQGSRARAESAAEALRTAIAQYLVRAAWLAPGDPIPNESQDASVERLGEQLAATTTLVAALVTEGDQERLRRARALYAALERELAVLAVLAVLADAEPAGKAA
jgi:hypothetical protein